MNPTPPRQAPPRHPSPTPSKCSLFCLASTLLFLLFPLPLPAQSPPPQPPSSLPLPPPPPPEDPTPASPPHPTSLPASSPLHQKWLNALRSPQQATRYRALQQLAQKNDPHARALLILTAQNQREPLRWIALAALRQRKDPTLLPLFQKALQDPNERARLNAFFALQDLLPPEKLASLDQLQRDPSSLVRAAWCENVLKQRTHHPPQRLQSCLADRFSAVRRATADAILRNPLADESLKNQAREILTQATRQQGWLHRRRFFGRTLVPDAVLQSRLRALENSLRYEIVTLARWKDELPPKTPSHTCLEQSLTLIKKHQALVTQHSQQSRKAFYDKKLNLAQQHYSLALYNTRLAQQRYAAKARRCYYAYRQKQRMDRQRPLKELPYFDGFPLYLSQPSKSKARLHVNTSFLYDSFIDLLRDDLHPSYLPHDLANAQTQRWDLGVGLQLRGLYQYRWQNGLLFRVDATTEARYFFRFPEIGIFSGRLALDLMHTKRLYRQEHLFFLRSLTSYDQDAPEASGWPHAFAGERLSLHNALGFAWRHLFSTPRGIPSFSRRAPYHREFSLSLRFDHHTQLPSPLENTPPASPHHQLRAHLNLRYQHNLYLGLALDQSYTWHHLPHDATQSAHHSDTQLHFILGRPLHDLHLIVGAGIAARIPILNDAQRIAWPSALTQTLYTPTIRASFQSQASLEPRAVHWELRFERNLLPSFRFDHAYAIDYSFLAAISFGYPPSLLAPFFIPPRLALSFDISLHFLAYASRFPTERPDLPPIETHQQLIRLRAKARIPLPRSFAIEAILQTDFVTQGFRSYLDNQPEPPRLFPREDFFPRVLLLLRLHFDLFP